MLVLPAKRQADSRLESLLESGFLPGVWGEPVLPVDRLVIRLLEGEGRFLPVLNDVERSALLRASVEDCAREGLLGDLGGAEATEGFHRHLARAIEGLKQAAVEPDAFREAVAGAGTTHGPVVAAIYESYQNRLIARGVYDRLGLFWEAALLCHERRPHVLEGTDTLLFDGFDDFTPSEFRLVEALAPHVETLVIGLNLDRDPRHGDLFRLQAATLGRVAESLAPEITDAARTEPDTLAGWACRHLLSREVPPPFAGDPSGLMIRACADAVHEAEQTGRAVKALLLAGEAAGDIVVTCRNLAAEAPLLRAVFREQGIPARIAAAPSVAESAVGSFLLHFLDTLRDWRREAVAALLASPWMHPADDAERAAMEAAPVAARLAGIVGGEADWQQGLGKVWVAQESGCEPEDSENAATRLEECLKPLAGALADRVRRLHALAGLFPHSAPPRTYVAALDQMLELCDTATAASGLTDPLACETEQAALARLHELLGQLHQSYDEDSPAVTRDAFLRRFREAAASARHPAPAPRGAVLCLDLAHLRNLRFRHVFLCGANEGILPAGAPQNALFSDGDVARLHGRGVPVETRDTRADREWSLFHHALAAAEKTLTITWRARSADGREARPSPYVEDLLALPLPAGCVHDDPGLDPLTPPPDQIASERDLRNLSAAAGAPPPGFRGRFPALKRGIVVELRRNSARPFDHYDGVLGQSGAVARVAGAFGQDHCFSVQQIESHAACPFRFYVERVLRVTDIEEPETVMDARERGILAHAVLERLFASRPGEAVTAETLDDWKAALGPVLEGVLGARAARAMPGLRALYRAEAGNLLVLLERHLDREAADSSPWTPAHLEVSFGPTRRPNLEPPGKPAPYPFETPSGTVLFSGIIDRIDSGPGGSLRVVDYKTGKAPGFRAQLAGQSIQLAVYARAVTDFLMPGADCREARFIAVGRKPAMRDYMRRPTLEDEKKGRNLWEPVIDAAKETVAGGVGSIRAGQFPPDPQPKVCDYCPWQAACRHDENRTVRKKGDAGDAP
jgi:ATP-dependent helicase/nuclease subunit B